MPSPEKKKNESLEKNWLNYALLHEPDPEKTYTAEKKKEMASKRMAAAFMNARNVMSNGAEAPFSVAEARKTAAAISGTYAFQAMAADEESLNRLLSSDVEELRNTTAQIYNPFGHLSFEQKKALILRLQQEVLPEMAETEGRSEKYRSMVDSIQSIDVSKLEDSPDPQKNGDMQLNNVLLNTEKYLKGKKSLRKNDEEQARFNHGVDIMGVLGSSGGGAMLRYKGMVHRINEVRTKRKQQTISAADYGRADTVSKHGQNLKQRKIGKQILQNEDKIIPVHEKQEELKSEPALKEAEPPKEKEIVYEGVHTNISEKAHYQDNPELLTKIPAYPAEGKNFVTKTDEMYRANLWNSLKDSRIMPMVGKQMLAAIMADHSTQMFRNPATGELGVDAVMYKNNYDKYMKDPAIDLMAEKLQDPEERSKICNDAVTPTTDKIDSENLLMTYMDCQKEAAKNVAPVMGL